jgi:hypothetical protein
MFLIHRTSNDKTLSVPVAQQLYGLLAYATSQGDIPFRERLPLSRGRDRRGTDDRQRGRRVSSCRSFPTSRRRARPRLASPFDAQRLGACIQERQKERN